MSDPVISFTLKTNAKMCPGRYRDFVERVESYCVLDWGHTGPCTFKLLCAMDARPTFSLQKAQNTQGSPT